LEISKIGLLRLLRKNENATNEHIARIFEDNGRKEATNWKLDAGNGCMLTW
jgi:hypothetical protein